MKAIAVECSDRLHDPLSISVPSWIRIDRVRTRPPAFNFPADKPAQTQ
jgi:hypothetical protein